MRRGIPHYFRAIVWQLLCGASDADKKQYADYIKATSACEKVIRRDIARTYPEHDFFKEKDGLGQEALFNVMKAYSLHDREVGYCQGSGFIVGLLLMQVCDNDIDKRNLISTRLLCTLSYRTNPLCLYIFFYPCNLVVFTTFSVFEIVCIIFYNLKLCHVFLIFSYSDARRGSICRFSSDYATTSNARYVQTING